MFFDDGLSFVNVFLLITMANFMVRAESEGLQDRAETKTVLHNGKGMNLSHSTILYDGRRKIENKNKGLDALNNRLTRLFPIISNSTRQCRIQYESDW